VELWQALPLDVFQQRTLFSVGTCMHILMFEMLEAHMLVQEGLVHTIHG
jgi:hypothetical protein